MSNVVPLFGTRKKAESKPVPMPYSIQTVIESVTDWAEANGIDIHNDVRFQFRLADFMALMQSTIAEKDRMSA